MNRKILYIVTGILIALNIYSLYRTKSYKSTVNKIRKTDAINNYSADRTRDEQKAMRQGKTIITSIEHNMDAKIELSPINKHVKKGIIIYFLFRGADCTNCIVQTWHTIRELKQEYSSAIKNVNSFFFQKWRS